MIRSSRMRVDERSIVSTPTAAAPAAERPEETGSAAGNYRRSFYTGVARVTAASGWKASFMSV